MNDFQHIWEAIPIRHDWISYFLMSGVVIAVLLIITIISRWKSSSSPTRLLSVLILCLGLTTVDIFLGYTGLMKYVLSINNFSEPAVILIIPIIYLIIRNIITRSTLRLKFDAIHFILPVTYALYAIPNYIKPLTAKLFDYTRAYHPDLHMPIELAQTSIHKPTIYIAATIYLYLLARLFYQNKSKLTIQALSTNKTSKIRFVRNSILTTILFIGLTIFIYTSFQQDLGDHIIGLALSYIILSISYFIYNESRIFTSAWIADKYETTSYKTTDPQLLIKAKRHMLNTGFHLESSASLKGLSDALAVSPNLLSQKINSDLNRNFNEFINEFRIEESQKRLLSDDYTHLSIDGIGQSVGFKSKSSFYAAFKKRTSMTPSAYRKANMI